MGRFVLEKAGRFSPSYFGNGGTPLSKVALSHFREQVMDQVIDFW